MDNWVIRLSEILHIIFRKWGAKRIKRVIALKGDRTRILFIAPNDATPDEWEEMDELLTEFAAAMRAPEYHILVDLCYEKRFNDAEHVTLIEMWPHAPTVQEVLAAGLVT